MATDTPTARTTAEGTTTGSNVPSGINVPAAYTPIGCLSVGYPGPEDPRSPSLRRGRRGVEEVVHRGTW